MLKKVKLSTTQIIMLSFLLTIFIGTFLLLLPISSKTGESVSFIDALFTATTATCVTGLVTLPTVSTWSTFGHIVILFLIQIGGLGVVTSIIGITVFFKNKLNISDTVLIQEALNMNTLSGLSTLLKKILKGTFIVEFIGMIMYLPVFVKDFGIKGVWISLFNSISAFCNAGIDIIAENSLCNYATNPIINITTSLLIVTGGIGFIVWWDVLYVLKNKKRKRFQSLTLHSKLVLITTLFLIIVGAVFIFIFEYNNPLTIGNLNIFDKIQVSIFQSITTRTAGFASIPQEYLTNSSAIICLILMFIGGSPAGTAGGIKTTTILVFILVAYSIISNKEDVNIFDRRIHKSFVNKSISVMFMSFLIMLISTLMLSMTMQIDMMDILYETISATSTVGLTRNLTPSLNTYGKVVIILTMYLGRVSPISLAVAFNSNKNKTNLIKNPAEDIIVG